jgi:hypothetical protein
LVDAGFAGGLSAAATTIGDATKPIVTAITRRQLIQRTPQG